MSDYRADDNFENRFQYHAPDDAKAEVHRQIRDMLYSIAVAINDIAPISREKSLVFTKLEEAMFWANAAVARYPLP